MGKHFMVENIIKYNFFLSHIVFTLDRAPRHVVEIFTLCAPT